MSLLDKYNILHHLQRGFRQGHNLWNLLSNLASGNQTDLIITDFFKAIDEVCHKK